MSLKFQNTTSYLKSHVITFLQVPVFSTTRFIRELGTVFSVSVAILYSNLYVYYCYDMSASSTHTFIVG